MEPTQESSFFKIELNQFFWILIISIFWIILGLGLLALSPSHIYGVLLGISATWISIGAFLFFSFLLGKYIKSPKKRIFFNWLVFAFSRLFFFILILTTSIILINNYNEGSNEIKLIIEPINIILVVLSYQTFPYALILAQFFKLTKKKGD